MSEVATLSLTSEARTNPATDPSRSAGAPLHIGVLIGVTVLGILSGLATQGLVPAIPVMMVVAVPLVVLAAVVAITRFEVLVLGLLVARSSLDVFTQLDGSGPPIAAAVGAAFLGVAGLWLIVQILSGSFVQPSGVTITAIALGAVVVFSVVASAQRGASAATAGRIVAGVLMFVVLEQLLARGSVTWPQLVGVLLASAVVPTLYGLIEIIGPTPLDPITQLPRVSSTFVHPNALATYLVLVTITAAGLLPRSEGAHRWALGALMAGSVIVIGYTFTRVGYVALVLGLLYLGGRHSKAIAVLTVGAAVAALMFVPSIADRFSDLSAEAVNDRTPANSIEWRFQYWRQLAPLATESPGTGIGVGSVLADPDWTHAPHNVWLQLAVEAGAPGVIAGLSFGAALAFHLIRREQTASRLEHSTSLRHNRTQATAATASALAFFTQTGTENLLDSTLLWWYLAAALAIGTGGVTAARISPMEQS